MSKRKIKIFLDFGHGGSDSGAVSGALIEKAMNLITGLECKDILEQYDIEVMTSRDIDKTVSLAERVRMANEWGADYFVSIHYNAGGGDRGEVIHSIYRNKGLALANSIAASMKSSGQDTMKIYERRGQDNKDYYYVIKNTRMDAVIVEGGFIDNAVDRQLFDTVEEQKAMGRTIAHGILNHLGIAITQSKPQQNIQYGTVTATELNVRAGRGNGYDIWDTLKQGAKVELGSLENGWYLVYYNNGEASGYVSAKYIK